MAESRPAGRRVGRRPTCRCLFPETPEETLAVTDHLPDPTLTGDTVEAARQATRERLLALYWLLNEAAGVAGGPPTLHDPLTRFRDRHDTTWKPSLPALFWELATLWILSDRRRHREKQVHLVMPTLRPVRANAARCSEPLEPAAALTASEVALPAARHITHICEGHFGCSRL